MEVDSISDLRSPTRWTAATLVVAGIVALSLGPFPQPDLPGPLEHFPHLGAYAAMMFALAAVFAAPGRSRHTVGRVLLIALGLILLGVALEGGQRIVGRDVEVSDAVANTVGVVLAATIWLALRWSRRRSGERGGERTRAR